MNTAMLLVAARLSGREVRLWRVLAAAICGALLAQASRCLTRGQAAALWPHAMIWLPAMLWLPAAAGMMAIACGRDALRHPVRYGALLLCAAGLLGGIVLALQGATGSLMTAYALGGGCTLWIATFTRKTRRAVQTAGAVRLICRYRGARTSFDGMIDSGNTLVDYLTHLPVIVMPEAAGRRRFHLGDAPLRPIFADTAGGRQMMRVLTPQEVCVEANGRRRTVRAVVALSPGMREGTPAFVPASLMDKAEESCG